MALRISQGQGTFLLLGVVLVVALVLGLRSKFMPTPAIIVPETPKPTVSDVASDWRGDVTRILAEYDQSQDARAAEQALLALHVADQDREVHLALVIAFHTVGESKPEGKSQLTAARTRFASGSSVLR